MDSADAALSAVEANKTAMETAVTDLQNALSGVTTNLDNAFAACAGSCPTANKPDYSGASPDIDTSAVCILFIPLNNVQPSSQCP